EPPRRQQAPVAAAGYRARGGHRHPGGALKLHRIPGLVEGEHVPLASPHQTHLAAFPALTDRALLRQQRPLVAARDGVGVVDERHPRRALVEHGVARRVCHLRRPGAAPLQPDLALLAAFALFALLALLSLLA